MHTDGICIRFPAAAVVERWQAAGARVLRTDRAGAVQLRISPAGEAQVSTRLGDSSFSLALRNRRPGASIPSP